MQRERSILLRIRAQVDGAVKRSLREVSEETRKVGEQSKKTAQAVRDNSQSFTTAGTALTAFGATTTLALGLSAKAAIDWEQAFTGVRKTVNGSEAELSGLSQGIRDLSRELPASANEIAGVAEAAGQLGIKTPNILEFTKTMTDLGETTNLSADQAASSIARFANVMGTSQSEFDNLGSAIVGLGNNFATTESEIVEMAQRLAGAGRQAGLTEGDVLGIATALSSLGIEAEAGGTAFSRVLLSIGKSVDSGNESLATFASVSGQTAEQFAQQWASDSGGAVSSFIEGLGAMQDSGKSIQPILEELGFTDIRVGDALRRSASASDLFAEAMARGNADYSANVALTKEAELRYGTVASQLAIAKNSIVDAAVSLGETFLPAIVSTAEGAADLAGFIADLPEPLTKVVGGLSGIAGVGALAAGGLLLVVPRALETYDAFRKLNEINPKVAGGLGKVGKAAAGGLAALAVASIALDQLTSSGDDVSASMAELANILQTQIPNSGDVIADSFGDIFPEDQLARGEAFRDTLDELVDPGRGNRINEFFVGVNQSITGAFGSETENSNFGKVKQRLADLGVELGALAASDLPKAQEAFRAFYQEAGGDERAGKLLLETMPALRAELTEVATQMGLTVNDATLLKIATGEIAPAAEDAASGVSEFAEELDPAAEAAEDFAEANDRLRSSIEQLGSPLLAARAAARDYESAVRDANDAVKENGKTLDVSTEKGQANQEILDGLAESTVAYTTAAFDAGASTGELTALMADGRVEFINAAREMGLTRAEAETLADSLGLIPENIDLLVKAEGMDEARGEVDGVTEYANNAQGFIQFGARPGEAYNELEAILYDTNNSTGTVDIAADDTKSRKDLRDILYDTDRSTGTIDLDGNDRPGQGVLRDLVRNVNDADGTIDVDAKVSKAQRAINDWFSKNSGRSIKVSANVGAQFAANGGMWSGGARRFADGGTTESGQSVPRQSMMGGPQYGRTNILWGEPETGWEAYISGKPGMEARNRQILGMAASKLGMNVATNRYAAGAFNDDMKATFDLDILEGSLGNLTRALDRASSKAFMSAGGPGGPRLTGGIAQLLALARPFGVPITSTYRPGARTATGFLSKHGQRKAVDTGLSKAFWDYLEPQKNKFSELYSPWGLWNKGLPRSRFPGWQTVKRIHQDHIHMATYAKGGTVGIDAHHGEHVLTTPEVDAFGGHDAVYRMRKAALAGDRSFAIGGTVGQSYGQRYAAMSSAQPAPQITVGAPSVGDIYVQNPWTGDYMRAEMVTVANGQIATVARSAVGHGAVRR